MPSVQQDLGGDALMVIVRNTILVLSVAILFVVFTWRMAITLRDDRQERQTTEKELVDGEECMVVRDYAKRIQAIDCNWGNG